MGLHLYYPIRVNRSFNNNNNRKPNWLSHCFIFRLLSLKSLSFPYSAPLQVTCTGLPDVVIDALPGRWWQCSPLHWHLFFWCAPFKFPGQVLDLFHLLGILCFQPLHSRRQIANLVTKLSRGLGQLSIDLLYLEVFLPQIFQVAEFLLRLDQWIPSQPQVIIHAALHVSV